MPGFVEKPVAAVTRLRIFYTLASVATLKRLFSDDAWEWNPDCNF